MTTLKDLKGTAIQFLDEDPVVYVGSWSSGGSLNTARTALQSSGTGTDNAIVGGGYNASSSPSRVQSEQYNGTAWTETNNINNSRMFGSGAGTATAAIISGGDPTGYTETWDGSSWSEVAEMNTARNQQQNIGTVPSALAIGGGNPSAVTNVESWNGSAWTETATDLNTAKKYVVGTGIVTACIVMGTPATTEQFNGSSWTEIAESNAPHSSGAASGIVTDALFYGGDNPSLKSTTETWNGSAWTEVSDLATARAYLGGAQNSSSGSTNSLAFGGSTPSQTTATEEWTFPPATASTLQEGDMWFNSSSSTLKGYGTAAGIPAGTWASGASMNTARGRAGFATSEAPGHIALVYGGIAPPNVANTEQYNGTSWTELNDINTTRNGFGGGGVSTAAIYSGGETTANSAKSELWDGSSWTESTDINTARRGTTGFAGTNTAAILASGYTTTAVAITEQWNGSSWTEVADQNAAKFGRCGTGTTTAGILAGGNNPTVLVETWDGSSWTEVGDLNTAREYGAISGTSGIAIVAGGYPSKTNVEAWNGTSWSEINDIAQQRYQGMGNGNAAFGLICGGDVPPGSALTEEFTAPATVSTVTTS